MNILLLARLLSLAIPPKAQLHLPPLSFFATSSGSSGGAILYRRQADPFFFFWVGITFTNDMTCCSLVLMSDSSASVTV